MRSLRSLLVSLSEFEQVHCHVELDLPYSYFTSCIPPSSDRHEAQYVQTFCYGQPTQFQCVQIGGGSIVYSLSAISSRVCAP